MKTRRLNRWIHDVANCSGSSSSISFVKSFFRSVIGADWCNLRSKIQEEFMDVAPRNKVNGGGRKEQRQTNTPDNQQGIVLFEGGNRGNPRMSGRSRGSVNLWMGPGFAWS
jgi:hypothetical protein